MLPLRDVEGWPERGREWPRVASTKAVGHVEGPRAQPHLSQTSLSLTSRRREILGLVDLVALENGELGPLLSAGTLQGLEDECVTDVKVPPKWPLGMGRGSVERGRSQWTWKASPCPLAVSLSLW